MNKLITVYWRDIPAQVIGRKGRKSVCKKLLDPRFQHAIDRAAMRARKTSENAYLEDWRRVLDVNLWGPIIMVRAFLPSLKRNGGHIVNVASVDGLLAIPGSAAYSVSKFGLVGFSEVLGIELSGYGIGVTAVCPGFTWTPMVDTISIKGYSRDKLDKLLRFVKPLVFTTPEKLSLGIIKAVKRNRAVFAHTAAGRILYFIKRLSPRLYRDLVGIPLCRMLKRLE